jgi:prevent-host-death family protein
MITVSMSDARTNFSKLLEHVQAGEEIIITRHGKEVARLVPPAGAPAATGAVDAIARWRKARRGVKLKGLRVRDLIMQGQR